MNGNISNYLVELVNQHAHHWGAQNNGPTWTFKPPKYQVWKKKPWTDDQPEIPGFKQSKNLHVLEDHVKYIYIC